MHPKDKNSPEQSIMIGKSIRQMFIILLPTKEKGLNKQIQRDSSIGVPK